MSGTDYDAEQYVLSAMMRDARAVWDVFGVIQPGDFREPKHEAIAQAVLALANRNAPTGPIAVAEELRQAQSMFDPADLFRIEGYASTWVNADFYADIVRKDALRRRLREAGGRLADLSTAEGDAATLAEEARAVVDRAASADQSHVRPVGDALNGVVDALDHDPTYFETPWREINSYIHGFKPGAVYVVAARPGAGKSIMALQAAAALAEHGNVAFSSLEMDESELIKRLLASKASVSMSALARHTLSPSDWAAVAEARASIAGMRLFIDDRSGVTLAQIKAHARTVSRRGPLAGIVVDYLGLVQTNRTGKTPRWEAVGELTREVKALARDMQVPVILLVQLNRESEGQHRRLPSLVDLRESGSIEQDADVVLLLQRRHDKDGNATDDLDVVVGKNRQGQVGKTALQWEGKFARVTSPPWTPFAGFTGTTDWKQKQAGD